MRRTAAPLTALLLLTLTTLVALLATPAAAGGPTSVLLSAPGTGVTASLYHTDDDYGRLAELLGVTAPDGTGRPDRSGQDHTRGSGITLTWMIHDVTPWRVDRVYLGGREDTWVATQSSSSSETSFWDSPVVWHRPTDENELLAVLGRLGVAGAAREAEQPAGSTPREAPAGPAVTPQADETALATRSATPAWRDGAWAFGGLAVGLAGGVGLVRAWQRRDSDPVPVDVSGSPGEQLVWPAVRRG